VTSGSGPGQSAFDASEREVLEWIAGGAPLGEVLEGIVRLVEGQAPGMCCSILLLDREQRCVRYGAAPSLPPEFNRAIDGTPIGPEAGSCGTAAYLGKRVVVEDIAIHPSWTAYKHLALPHGLRACWSSPIFSTKREVLGTFAMYYREPRGPRPREVAWVDGATHLAAIAIGHEAAAQALRRSEAHYRRIADTAHEGIWLLDTAGRTLFANRRLGEMLRCGPDELEGTAIFDFLDAAGRPEVEQRLASPLGAEAEQHDVRLRRRDGTDLWAIVSSSPVSDDDGRLVGTLAMVTDITERQEAEAKIRRLVHDLGERVKELTLLHRTASLLQADRPYDQAFLAELVAPIPLAWQHPEVCEARIACGIVEAQTPGWRQTPWMQSVSFTAGGLDGVIEVAYLAEKPIAAEGPFLAEERALLRSLADMLSAHVDRQRTQAQLRQAQRIQALGTLAGGIAHDFNNVLVAVGGNAELAARGLPADHPAHKHLRRIEQATARAADLVQRILAFSRQQEPRWASVALQPVVEEVLKLLRATLPAAIQIRTRLAADAPRVRADSSQIHQVLMNLGTNAAHAMGERGGVLEVRLEAVTQGAGAGVAPELGEGRYVKLSVSDTGSGMDRATLERIFEPFYTTKAPGHGTGLGLSVVHGIMKSHDAAITVDSQVGVGTTFHLYFPAADSTVTQAAAPPTQEPRGDGEHVLYVDDEEAIVSVATLVLHGLGYRVTGSTDAGQALEDFRSRPYEFAAVVADLSMPGLSGAELARQVREIRPGIPVVLTSGYVRPEDAEAVQPLGLGAVLPKPSLVADLGPTLHRLLTRQRSAP
jgi:PAS domain S-box-containing protein